MLLAGRPYPRVRVDDSDRQVTAVLDCDGPAEAALRALQLRSRVELTFGNHVVRGTLDDCRFTHEGRQQIATVVVSKRDQDGSSAHMYDMAWGGSGGGESLSADEIAGLRASRILTGTPKAKKANVFGAEMLIRGGMHDGLQIDQSPIPDFLATKARDDRKTWEHLRLELVRQLIVSRSVERIETLHLTVENDQLVHVTFRGVRHQYSANIAPYVVEVDEAVKF